MLNERVFVLEQQVRRFRSIPPPKGPTTDLLLEKWRELLLAECESLQRAIPPGRPFLKQRVSTLELRLATPSPGGGSTPQAGRPARADG